MKQNLLTVVTFCLFYLTQLTIAQGIIKDDFLVNDDTTISNIEHKYSSAAISASGEFIVVWMDYRSGNNDIYFQRFDSNGLMIGVNTKVNDDAGIAGQANPSVAIDGSGNFIVAWLDNRNGNDDIYFQRFNSSGTLFGVNTKANDDAGSAWQECPRVSIDASGNFVIVWCDYRNNNRDIFFQRYNSNGVAQGINIKANNDSGTLAQSNPSIAVDGAGNFIIVWHDYRNGNNYDIYFQRYNSNGALQGINTKVNDDTGTGGQYNASVAMDIPGNFVIAWADGRNFNYDIYFQKYNSNGVPEGFNTKVNDDTGTVHQDYPSAAMDDLGNFVIVWSDNRYLLSKPDVIGQKFYSNGNPWGTNYLVVTNGINNGESFPVVAANINQIIFSWMDNRRTTIWDIYGKLVLWNWGGVTTVLSEKNISVTFSLSQNYPNPFNPSTNISWQSPVASWQTIKIFDVLGREIETIVDGYYEAGLHSSLFIVNSSLPSGVYFYQLKAGDPEINSGQCFIQTKKMMFLK